ncbi:curli production assembly/transport component csgg [Novosphingobium sp. AAP83]|uniref:CsgG/HfaB family protein n=1 Tax=Novosphingobium sp. AAP83 TaxID=1523425 RepID=UPI0006B8CA2E|nr:CsgG/HfaB family protein [Novosphingobium sp. AAP83]KPF90840.1 curli production assembly/transport component csgg [Novosphingobium sp. AAP83]
MKHLLVSLTAASLISAPAVAAPKQAKPSNAEKLQRKAVADVPRCDRKLGTISIMDGDDPTGWAQFSLAPPQKLLKVIVQRSGCFNLVDRGSGLNAARLEREIGAGLGLQRKSNVGQNQIKAADYVLVAEVQASNGNAQGSGAVGAIGGILGGPFGGLLGGIRSRKLEANTVLSVTNVRTTETIATVDGYAAKNDIGIGGGGVFFAGIGAGAVGGGYDSTDIGRIVTLAFIDAYTKLVTELGGVQAGSAGTAEASPTKSFTAIGPSAMRKTAAAGGAVIRTLPVGSIVYPTGNKQGLWWEVADENDNVGWVLNTKLQPAN